MAAFAEPLYVALIVAGNVLAGTAMYSIDNMLFAGPLYALSVVVAAAYGLSVAMSLRTGGDDSTQSSGRFHL
jgi:hypothetical protein